MSANFWNNPQLEPKRGFRFLIQWSINGESLTFLAKQVSRPSYTVSSNPHKFFNHTFHYPGRVEWNTVSLTLVDAISPNAANIFMNYLSEIGYVDPVNLDIATSRTITKKSATAASAGLTIHEKGTDDNGNTIDIGTWELKNAFVTEANFGEHSYDSEEMIDIQLTVQYDWAQYNKLRD